MTARREEAAIDILSVIAPVLTLLPDSVLEAMSGAVIASDIQASNVPIYPGDTFLAGAKVLRQYGIGPLPGVAIMAVLISRGAMQTVTAHYDRAAIDDTRLFAQCLRQGFDEVLALAGPPAPGWSRGVVPRFSGSVPQRKNGSVAYHERQGITPARIGGGSDGESPGPTVGAFFDLDGTLVAGFTAVILTRERFRSRDMGIGELISMIAAGLNHQFGRMEFESPHRQGLRDAGGVR